MKSVFLVLLVCFVLASRGAINWKGGRFPDARAY